ncbi:UNVERIFIED_CONTAM: hypothetical protein FKN15_041859 [Acipenser sinensis]
MWPSKPFQPRRPQERQWRRASPQQQAQPRGKFPVKHNLNESTINDYIRKTKKANPDPNNCIGVFGLSLYTTERDLREVFSKYGPLADVSIVYDQQSRRSRGFAFVYFETKADSKEAKERANGMELDGRRIRVDFSITKRPHTPTPGIYMGRPTYGGSGSGGSGGGGGSSSSGGGGGSSGGSRRSREHYDRGYDRGYDRYDDRDNYNRSYRIAEFLDYIQLPHLQKCTAPF